MLKPIKAWVIAGADGTSRFTVSGGMPELFSSHACARTQNIDWRNGSKVVRVEIRQVKLKKRK